jgi:DnaJ-domain-containing protein 1
MDGSKDNILLRDDKFHSIPTRWMTPEERELDRKKAELVTLQLELSQRELDLVTRKSELRSFENRYLSIVGVRYAELDEINARIAEAKARAHPEDTDAGKDAAKARKQAEETAQQVNEEADLPKIPKFKAPEKLKKKFREIVKKIHPDLADDDEDRLRRQKLMAEANAAYERGDIQKLEQILREWESSPESVKGEGISAELVRVIRKIALIRERLKAIDTQINDLKKSDLWVLKIKVEKAESQGQDLLAQMATEIEERIKVARTEFDSLMKVRA